ncbi:hypothetical protein TIFTF001_034508 [Ficus carica]|uniref:Uncharacterized protein n=1 Tax=Ficus carica TaxID=3494 RepID=A0AA88J972_FICCA|nr:hypothetical protein TIFTF001_034508 [Ficus carica]
MMNPMAWIGAGISPPMGILRSCFRLFLNSDPDKDGDRTSHLHLIRPIAILITYLDWKRLKLSETKLLLMSEDKNGMVEAKFRRQRRRGKWRSEGGFLVEVVLLPWHIQISPPRPWSGKIQPQRSMHEEICRHNLRMMRSTLAMASPTRRNLATKAPARRDLVVAVLCVT